jgi:hypothetical protein
VVINQSFLTMSQKWICQTWKEHPEDYESPHVFEQNTEDGFCPLEPRFHGILVKEIIQEKRITVRIGSPDHNEEFDEGTNITILAEVSATNGPEDLTVEGRVEFFVDARKIGEDPSPPFTQTYLTSRGVHQLSARFVEANGESTDAEAISIQVKAAEVIPEVALCVILMDGSSSMTDPAFKGSPLTRMRLVATTAASGIFDLERMQNNPHAFVAAFKFDDRVQLMFVDTIASLINRYDKDVLKFANYLHDELEMMQQGTDINMALAEAYAFVEHFIRGTLPGFPLKKYRVMMQRIFKYTGGESISVANVRVLMYTDGMQFDANENRTLLPNPFEQKLIEGINHDVVIGAYFGESSDEGCQGLQRMLSRCPIHDEEQFFLFDRPGKIQNLKFLFRMASGASGFCPKCLEKELIR